MSKKPIRILVVDEHVGDARLLQEYLADSKFSEFKVFIAADLPEMFTRLSQNDVDLILLGLSIPGQYWEDIFNQINSKDIHLPIILVTGWQMEQQAIDVLQYGVQDYLIKGSFDNHSLERAIRYAIERYKLLSEWQLNEARIRKIIEKLADGILILDQSGVIRFANPATEYIFARSAEDLIGEYLGIPIEGVERKEMNILQSSGQSVVVEMNVAPIEWDGQPAFLLSLRDITSRVEVQEIMVRQNRELTMLNSAGRAFVSTLSLDQVLVSVLKEIHSLLKVFGSFWLIDENTNELVCRQASGANHNIVRGWRLSPGEGIVGWVARNNESVIVSDIQKDPRHFPSISQKIGVQFRSSICVPLRYQLKTIGVLQILDERPNRFDDRDLALVESLSLFATIAVTNARLFSRIDELRAFNENIIESMDEGIMINNAAGKITFVNPKMINLLGYKEDELVGNPTHFCVLTDQQDVPEKTGNGRLPPYRYETHLIAKSGSKIPVIASAKPLYDGDGNHSTTITVFTDLTERVKAEEIRREDELRYRALFENTNDAVFILSLDLIHLAVNKQAADLLGYQRDELVGMHVEKIVAPQELSNAYNKAAKIRVGEKIPVYERTFMRKDGSEVIVEINVALVNNAKDEPHHIQSIVRDITQRKELEDHLLKMATHDHLTGLPNRVLLEDRLTSAIERSKRHQIDKNSHWEIAVFLLDLDNFKNVNDTYGHDRGDVLLQTVATRLLETTRKSDTVARLGGDEFIIVFENVNMSDDAEYLVEKVLSKFKTPVTIADADLVITTSIGVSLFPQDGVDVNTLLKRADIAMYRAKEIKNTHHFYSSPL